MQKKKWLGLVIGFAVLALVVAAAVVIYVKTRPEPQEGAKTITIQLVYDDVDTTVTIHTNAEYLRGALEEKNLIAGDESEYGLFVKTVNGRTADGAKQEWWCFTKGGETLMTGIDTTPIADEEVFEVTLMVGYDSF
ncbi:MAG: DUF4430 domain-containing protein [Clostridia bacterium]|nr:DUF4430 domain-containing protein [Clostridia bacterium]